MEILLWPERQKHNWHFWGENYCSLYSNITLREQWEVIFSTNLKRQDKEWCQILIRGLEGFKWSQIIGGSTSKCVPSSCRHLKVGVDNTTFHKEHKGAKCIGWRTRRADLVMEGTEILKVDKGGDISLWFWHHMLVKFFLCNVSSISFSDIIRIIYSKLF